jgi:hypothetical protein
MRRETSRDFPCASDSLGGRLSIYIYWHLKCLQLLLHADNLHFRILLHVELLFLDLRLSHPVLNEDNIPS